MACLTHSPSGSSKWTRLAVLEVIPSAGGFQDAQRNCGPWGGVGALVNGGVRLSRAPPRDGRRAHCSQYRVLPRRNLPGHLHACLLCHRRCRLGGAGAGVSDARSGSKKSREEQMRGPESTGRLRDSWLTPGCPCPQPVRTPLGGGGLGGKRCDSCVGPGTQSGKTGRKGEGEPNCPLLQPRQKNQ